MFFALVIHQDCRKRPNYTVTSFYCVLNTILHESTAGADASVEAGYNVASKKKPGDNGDRSSDS